MPRTTSYWYTPAWVDLPLLNGPGRSCEIRLTTITALPYYCLILNERSVSGIIPCQQPYGR